MEPFQSSVPHPRGRPLALARQKIDRRTDAQRYLRLDASAMLMNPQLLLGRAEADDQQVGPRRRNPSENRLVLGRVALESQGRTVGADDGHARPMLANIDRGPVSNTGRGPQQIDSQPGS